MSSLCRILTLLVAHELSASRGNIKTLWMPTVSFVQKYGFQRGNCQKNNKDGSLY